LREDGTIVIGNAAARSLPLEREKRDVLLRAERSRAVRLPFRGASLRMVALSGERTGASRGGAYSRGSRLPLSLSRVADGLARGLSDKEIADELSMPIATVRTYTSRVLKKLGVSSRRQLMLSGAARRGTP
jgi:DNA-binding NarL/FixJ family response regulator